jgi:phosphate:Na+ symporter
MTSVLKNYSVILPLAALLLAFWFSPDLQEVAAGVAIFLFGILMLQDGFKLLGGGNLERLLEAATRSTPRALAFGLVSSTLVQSSSLVSVLTISFLSAGLISLIGGIGIVFRRKSRHHDGCVAGRGSGPEGRYRGLCHADDRLRGRARLPEGAAACAASAMCWPASGFLFLGIHYMKDGFEAFRDDIDLSALCATGDPGLLVYTALGAAATVILQSSHATMVLVITALAAGQITYENAIALAIGANVGTTVTAIIGAVGANFQGKRLALAHLIFNLTTAAVALILVAQLTALVDLIVAQSSGSEPRTTR